jgi:hypothetical protein
MGFDLPRFTLAIGTSMLANSRKPNLAALGLLSFLVAHVGCQQSSGPAKYVAPKPAEKAHIESDLARTTLADDEVTSLRVRSEPVREEEVQERLPFTGWVMVKQGNEVAITAPVAGYVTDPGKDGALPVAGLPVKVGRKSSSSSRCCRSWSRSRWPR